MPQLIWSPSALRDIQRLYRFLALNNPEAARRAVKTIREDIRIIAEQPEVGRLADRMATEYR
ncbi:plasmid stabilization protein, partial [Pseudomonas savastanoi pv. nerii]